MRFYVPFLPRCGLLPLFFSLSPRHLRYVTTVGVGLLVGVAFIVIIPEGVHTYYGANSPPSSHSHSHVEGEGHLSPLSLSSFSPSSPPSPLSLLPSTDESPLLHTHAGEDPSPPHSHDSEVDDPIDHNPHPLTPSDTEEGHIHSHSHSDSTESSRHLLHTEDLHVPPIPCSPIERSSAMVGLALVSGFVLMLIVDRISGGHEGQGHTHGGGGGDKVSGGKRRGGDDMKVDVKGATAVTVTSPSNTAPPPSSSPPPPPRLTSPHLPTHPSLSSPSSSSSFPSYSNTALLGILTHSAIDGLALGAISVSENASLELVVFLAIILHKGPAAFGLASFLLYQGRGRGEVRWWMMVFSAAAPVTSLVTFLVFWQGEVIRKARGGMGEGEEGEGGLGSEMLGLCLLFSAGTFLFTIAVHILPEISRKEGGVTEWRYALCLITGILLPLTLGGHHHH